MVPLLAVLVLCGGVSTRPEALDISMSLAPDTIVLGQPVWVYVRVTNRSSRSLTIDMGSACFGARPLRISVPNAEHGSGSRERCQYGRLGGDCQVPFPPELDARQVISRRYVLRGDFRITHAGDYNVVLEKPVKYGALIQTQRATLMLHVNAPDRARLLDIEKRLIDEANATPSPPPMPSAANIDNLRKADSASRAQQYDDYLRRTAIAEGIASYPVSGLEPLVLKSLADASLMSTYAMEGLHNLNTPEARRILADIASGSLALQGTSPPRWLAVDYLSDMQDRSYLPLFERLLDDKNEDIRRAAVGGLGILGGAEAVPVLEAAARRSSSMQMRVDAIQSFGESQSLTAVPSLIALFTLANADQPNESDYALGTLTHHYADVSKTLPAPSVEQKRWQQWWNQNRSTAHAYARYECDPAIPRAPEWSLFQ